MMGTEQPPLPDPDTCTHGEWLSYLQRVDKDALDDAQFQAHQEADAAYIRRVTREADASRTRMTRALDEWDRTNAYAEEISQRKKTLHDQWWDQYNEVLRLRRLHPPDSPIVVEAQRRACELEDELDELRCQSLAANKAAIEAFRETRK